MWVLKVLWRTLLQKNIAFWRSVDIALHNLPAHDGLIAYILISAENILHLIKLGFCKIYNKKCAYRELKFTFVKKLRYQNKIMIFLIESGKLRMAERLHSG